MLMGCNKSDIIDTYVLYSDRFDGDKSVLIGYNKDGQISKNVSLDGFRYQNIGVFQEDLYITNGNSMYIFDSNLNSMNIINNTNYTDSSVEMESFNSNAETFYYIDNVGFIDNTYISNIFIGMGKSKVVVEGFITTHFISKDTAFIIYQNPAQIEEGNFNQNYVKINLNTSSIIDQGILTDISPCFSITGQPYYTDNDTIYFITESYDGIDNSKVVSTLVKYNIQSMKVVSLYELSRNSTTSDLDSKHLLKSDSVYFFNDKIKILYNDGTVLTLNESFEKIEEITSSTIKNINPVLTHHDSSNNVLSILNFENNKPKLYKIDLTTNENIITPFEQSEQTLGLIPYYFIR